MQIGHSRFCALTLFSLVSIMAAVKTKGNTNIVLFLFVFVEEVVTSLSLIQISQLRIRRPLSP